MAERMIPVEKICTRGAVQPREQMHEAVVQEYAEAMQRGEKFPPLEVFDDGENLWLADGWHRLAAAKKAGLLKAPCLVRKGGFKEAAWAAFGANISHGLRRTNADKRMVVTLALAHEKAAKLSNLQLANYLGVSEAMIRQHRDTPAHTSKHGVFEKSTDSNGTSSGTPSPEPALTNIPMGDDADSAESQAARYIAERRKKGYPDDRIALMAQTRPPEERMAILALLDVSEQETRKISDTPKDQVGQDIPEKLREVFARRSEIVRLQSLVSDLKTTVLARFEEKDALFLGLNPSQFKADCENLYRDLRALAPYAICPYCAGRGCKACLSRGWVGEFVWDAAPKELRKTK